MLNVRGPIRKLNGKPAVYRGVAAGFPNKIIVIVEAQLRFLTWEEWEQLPIWMGPDPPRAAATVRSNV